MNLDTLIADLRIDAQDETLGYYLCRRALERAVPFVNKDMSLGFEITRGVGESATIDPDPTGKSKEALLLMAQVFLAESGLISSSEKITVWKSGDKSVDRSRQSLTKENLANSLLALYRNLLGLDESSLLTPATYESVGADSYGGGIEVD